MANVGDTFTFGATGSLQTFTVPAGVKKINIDCRGAKGGNATDGTQGKSGGWAKGEFVVTGGQVLKIYVGKSGAQPAGGWGYQSGGSGYSIDAGGGGGASTVLDGTTVWASGGGGGGGYTTAGASAPGGGNAAGGTPNGGNGNENGTGYLHSSATNRSTNGSNGGSGVVIITVLEADALPTITLTSPADNLVLSEGSK